MVASMATCSSGSYKRGNRVCVFLSPWKDVQFRSSGCPVVLCNTEASHGVFTASLRSLRETTEWYLEFIGQAPLDNFYP